MNIRKLTKERKNNLKELWENEISKLAGFTTHLSGIEKSYKVGDPVYSYQTHKNQVKLHLTFWQSHPVWSKVIGLAYEKGYTKTNTTINIYFIN